MLHQENHRVGEIGDVEKLAFGLAAAPDGKVRRAGNLRFMRLPHQRGKDVAALEIEIVARPVKIGRHQADRVEAVLPAVGRSEEHTSELQSLMRISYAVFCLKKTKTTQIA